MTDKVMTFLADELNNYLKAKSGDYAHEKVMLANLVALDGSTAHLQSSSVIITLVNIEEERILKSQLPGQMNTSTGVAKFNPEIKLNLYVLFTANFGDNYIEALKFISYVIGFFQAANVFTSDTNPALDSRVKKIIADLHTLDFDQQNHLWGMLGSRYMPSVLYKIRLVTIQEESVKTVDGRIEIVNRNLSGM